RASRSTVAHWGASSFLVLGRSARENGRLLPLAVQPEALDTPGRLDIPPAGVLALGIVKVDAARVAIDDGVARAPTLLVEEVDAVGCRDGASTRDQHGRYAETAG